MDRWDLDERGIVRTRQRYSPPKSAHNINRAVRRFEHGHAGAYQPNDDSRRVRRIEQGHAGAHRRNDDFWHDVGQLVLWLVMALAEGDGE